VQEAYEIGLDKDPNILQLASELARSRSETQLIKSEIEAKAKPSPEEIRKVWESLNFVVLVRQIAVDTKQEAEEIRAAILSGADIEPFTRDCSRADSRKHAGRTVVSWGQMEPAWEKVVFALEPGELSPVIETHDGYEVVLVENRVDAERPPFDKVSGKIENALFQRRVEERKQQLSNELWQKYHVVLNAIDQSPMTLFKGDPETVIATWDNGGKLLLRDVAGRNDLRAWALLPPVRGRGETQSRIRSTINAPLLAFEGIARHTADDPAVAEEVRKYREYLMESALFREHIFKDVAVPDEENRKYYEEHKSEFVAPEQRHVAQILSSSEKDAAAVREKLASGTDFATAVKKFSRDPVSAMQDGDLGWITPEKVPGPFKQVLTLALGEVSKPIHSQGGWHLIKVTEIKPQRQLTFDEVKDKVAQKCLTQRREAARARWVEKLRAAATIEIDDAAIKQFVKANEFTGQAPPQHSLQ
jgi:peptidyl-prolyl cis-trans isomerase C